MGTGWGCEPNWGWPFTSVVKRDGELLFGGGYAFCDLNYDRSRLHRFDGQNWDTAGYCNQLVSLHNVGEEVFAVGAFDTLGTERILRIGRWNGASWEQFGDTSWLAEVQIVDFVTKYQGEYYFGGNFNRHPVAEEIIRWDGDSFESLDGGIKGDSWVARMVEYQGKLWVAGTFEQAAGNAGQCIQTWDGQQWENPFTGVYFTPQIKDMVVMDGVLYMAGHHYVLEDGVWKGPRWLARYDGQDFCSFGGEGFLGVILEPWGHRLLVGCGWVQQPIADTLQHLVEWVGGDQVDFCAPQGPPTAAAGPQAPAPLFAQVVPNPSQGHAELQFALQKAADVRIVLSDLLGRPVQTHALGRTGTGMTRLPLALDGLARGVYLCRIEARSLSQAEGGNQVTVLRLALE